MFDQSSGSAGSGVIWARRLLLVAAAGAGFWLLGCVEDQNGADAQPLPARAPVAVVDQVVSSTQVRLAAGDPTSGLAVTMGSGGPGVVVGGPPQLAVSVMAGVPGGVEIVLPVQQILVIPTQPDHTEPLTGTAAVRTGSETRGRPGKAPVEEAGLAGERARITGPGTEVVPAAGKVASGAGPVAAPPPRRVPPTFLPAADGGSADDVAVPFLLPPMDAAAANSPDATGGIRVRAAVGVRPARQGDQPDTPPD